jgi:hypothetical protein
MIHDYTTADQDAIEELISSRGHGLVKRKVYAELKKQRDQLEQLATPELTSYIRGQIAAYKTVLDIPGILRGEIAADLKENKQ